MSRTISPTERETQSSSGEPEQARAEVLGAPQKIISGGGLPDPLPSIDTGRVPAQMRDRAIVGEKQLGGGWGGAA